MERRRAHRRELEGVREGWPGSPLSPIVGFVGSALLLLLAEADLPQPELYTPPLGEDRPPAWIRTVLIGTCGGVSFAHGSNDGQKGMGLLLLVLIGFFPLHYALTVNAARCRRRVCRRSARSTRTTRQAGMPIPIEPMPKALAIRRHLAVIESGLEGPGIVRRVAARQGDALGGAAGDRGRRAEESQEGRRAAEWRDRRKSEQTLATRRGRSSSPRSSTCRCGWWSAPRSALGIGTTVGYKRIVKTVAEKIGKQHLTYAPGRGRGGNGRGRDHPAGGGDGPAGEHDSRPQ